MIYFGYALLLYVALLLAYETRALYLHHKTKQSDSASHDRFSSKRTGAMEGSPEATPEEVRLAQAPSGGFGAGAAISGPGMSSNLAAALAYIFPIAIVFLLIEPYKSIRFVRFHSLQAIFYAAAATVIQIGLVILEVVLSFMELGIVIVLIRLLISLGIFGLWIVLLVKAYHGEMFILPVIGSLAEKTAPVSG